MTASNSLGRGTTMTKVDYIYVKDVKVICSAPPVSSASFGKLYDDGGATGNYSRGVNCHMLLNPCGNGVVLKFNSFNFSTGDFVRVYDGTSNTGIPLFSGAGFTGNTIPAPVTASSGSMYIEEVTSFFGGPTASGFDADWSTLPYSKPVASFTAPDTGYNGGSPTQFTNTSLGNPDSWKWYFTNEI